MTWVLLGIAALLALICCVPVGATAEYSQEGAAVDAHFGPVTVRLYPWKKKKGTEKKIKPKKEKPAQKAPQAPTEKKRGGNLPMFRELLGLALEAQADLRNHLRIRELTLCLTVGGGGEDPAKSAVLYGRAWAAIGGLMPLLEQAFVIQSRDVRAEIDFFSRQTTVYGKATLSVRIGSMLRMAGYYGLRGLKLYRKHQKKGGSEHGTSNQ